LREKSCREGQRSKAERIGDRKEDGAELVLERNRGERREEVSAESEERERLISVSFDRTEEIFVTVRD
jgi:hypothetical protein